MIYYCHKSDGNKFEFEHSSYCTLTNQTTGLEELKHVQKHIKRVQYSSGNNSSGNTVMGFPCCEVFRPILSIS